MDTSLPDLSPVQLARQVLRQEAEALVAAAERISDSFAQAVALLRSIEGRVVLTGIGKSAHVGQKIVATLNSTGTPALFLHAAEALHGDLGMVLPTDAVIFLSKSGNTPEIKSLVPLIKRAEVPLIAIVGVLESYLARQADLVLDAWVAREADPNNLAPTTSTTLTLALGDALALALAAQRNFSDQDFARYHPGGSLGKRLYLRVSDLAHRNIPRVSPATPFKEVLLAISQGRLGATLVEDPDCTLRGIITDGDLRRLLERTDQPFSVTAADILSPHPKTVSPETLAYDALQVLEAHSILQLVVQAPGQPALGMIHLHDILNEGIR